MNASSVISITADNSFRGIVDFISLDLAVINAHDQVPSFNFRPAYMIAPPAYFAASAMQINLIPEQDSLSAGILFL